MFAGPARGLTGGKVLADASGFLGVVSVNGLMVYDALSTFRGEVAAHPYEGVGLQFKRNRGGGRAKPAALAGRRQIPARSRPDSCERRSPTRTAIRLRTA